MAAIPPAPRSLPDPGHRISRRRGSYVAAATLRDGTAAAGLGAMGLGQRLGFLIEPVGFGVLVEWLSHQMAVVVMGGGAGLLVLGLRLRRQRNGA